MSTLNIKTEPGEWRVTYETSIGDELHLSFTVSLPPDGKQSVGELENRALEALRTYVDGLLAQSPA